MSSSNGNGAVSAPAVQAIKDTVFGCTFGDFGGGKTVDIIYSFPNAFFIGPRGGISHVARSVVGYPVTHDDGVLYDIEAVVTQGLPWLAGEIRQGKPYTAAVIDDISILSQRQLDKEKARAPLGRSGNRDAFFPYTQVAYWLAALRDAARYYSVHVFCNAHPMWAWVDDRTGIRYKGRPKLAGKEAPVSFPALCDLVLRAEMVGAVAPGSAVGPTPFGSPVVAPTAEARVDWPGVYRNDPEHPDWLTKSRLNTPDYAPMNLAEIMRAGGYPVARPQGLEWTEDLVENATIALLQGHTEEAVLKQWANAQLKAKITDSQALFFAALWVRRDAKAHVVLRRSRLAVMRELGL